MTRRHLLWGALVAGVGAIGVSAAVLTLSLRAKLRAFLLPTSILEPTTTFKIGPLTDFPDGVSAKFLQEHRIFVVRNEERVYAIYAKCTHQGCTPDWRERDGEFRCPCHQSSFCVGSAFDGQGLNCAGPATRPLDRVEVALDSDGQVLVNSSKLYQWPKNGRSEFDDPGACISLSKT